MIKANELRIGNWVLVDSGVGAPPFLHRIIAQDIFNHFHESYTAPDWVTPIPLTAEILEKCGFIKNEWAFGFAYKKSFLKLGIVGYKKEFHEPYFYLANSTDDHYETVIDIKYVHQLQNLYFALTGEELQIIF